MLGDALNELDEVAAGELPLEGLGDGFVVALEVAQPLFDLGEVGEVVGGEDLSLDGGEVDLRDLVQPAGMDGKRDEGGVWPVVA